MRILLNEMRSVVDAEKERAQLNHGKVYHSAHEGYGVLVEELFEAETEHKHMGAIKQWLLNALHADDPALMIDCLEEMAERATLAACESAQVAAVALKLIDTLRGA